MIDECHLASSIDVGGIEFYLLLFDHGPRFLSAPSVRSVSKHGPGCLPIG